MLKKSGFLGQGQTLPTLPDLPDLHHLLSQALEKRGKSFQVCWRSADKLLTLEAVCSVKGGDPQWRLYRELGKRRETVFDYTSCDVLLIYNLILSSCADSPKPERAPGKPSASADAKAESSASAVESFMMSVDKSFQEQAKAERAPTRESPIPGVGELSKYPPAKLLQSIRTAKVTGRLEVRGPQSTAVVYMQDGLPVDATASDAVGDDAIIELLTWKTGHFVFEARVLRNNQTVHQSLESLLAQAMQLSERITYLANAGMKPSSTLLPKNPNLSELDFVKKVAASKPADVATLGKFYRSLNGRQTIDETGRLMQLSRNQLMQAVYHLVLSDVVTIGSVSSAPQPFQIEPRQIDVGAIQTVMMSLRRADTGMFIYPAFLYFLEQEYFRSYRAKNPLSVIVFEMRCIVHTGGEVLRQVLPIPALVDATLRMSQLKRHQDLLAHYDAFDYALILPSTKSGGANIFANRLVKCLTSSPLAGMQANQLALFVGSATIPEDFVDLSSMLGAADACMKRARETNQSVVMYRDLKNLML
jgi:Domain of unknown function (DUF4388)/Diguanylate cyclase, GGDEF domain